jgi:hypothetical protein
MDYNDIRFRIKNKINIISNSSLREQKGYKISRLIILINDEMDNIDYFINPIKYYSFIYDEIIIISNNQQLKLIFNYDNTIIFGDHNILINKEYNVKFDFIKNNYEKEQIYEILKIDNNIIKLFL